MILDIVRLRRVERTVDAVARREVAHVRRNLEMLVGPMVGRARAARLLGVTQTALDRWIARGDVGTVLAANGSRGLALGELVDLIERVNDRRLTDRRPLSAAVHERRKHAASTIDITHLLPELTDDSPRGHRLAELRSLALHRLVGERLDESRLEDAQARVSAWRERGNVHPAYVAAWEQILTLPIAELAARIGADTEEMRTLRQSSPFAGALTEPERRFVLDEIARRTAA